MTTETDLEAILAKYRDSFAGKIYSEENDDHDILMDVFGISPALKRENRQYWGRELGMCWQLLVIELCKHREDFQPALRIGSDEPCDLIVGNYAIDTKYRIGSGDSGTLKKFKSYGPLLRNNGYTSVFLILREDNLPAAIQACNVGTWEVKCGNEALNFVSEISGFDISEFLRARERGFLVER